MARKRFKFSGESIWAGLGSIVSSRAFIIATFAWFIFQCLYIATSTARGIGPDETYHYELIKLFSEHGISPILSHQDGYYFLGEVVRTPFTLYHYLLSFPFRIFGDSDASLFLLRSLNIPMACASLYLTTLIGKSLRLSKVVIHLSVFMLANTLMFVFLSSMVSYDNLFIPLSLLSIYLIIELSRKITVNRVLLLALVTAAGLLTKINFLPIAFASVVILFVLFWQTKDKTLKNISKEIAQRTKKAPAGIITLAFIVSALCGLAVYKYTSNIVSYRSFSPKCDKVLTIEQCNENFIYKRNKILNSDAPPNISISTYEYISRWTSIMLDRTFGILAHKNTAPTKLIATWYQMLLILFLVALVKGYRHNNKQTNLVIGIAVFYILVLAYDRYAGYHRSGLIDLAVQGRYLFGVLPVMYLLANKYILDLFSSINLRSAYVLITLFVFVTAGLPSYLIASDPTWYTSPTIRVNTKINQILNITDN